MTVPKTVVLPLHHGRIRVCRHNCRWHAMSQTIPHITPLRTTGWLARLARYEQIGRRTADRQHPIRAPGQHETKREQCRSSGSIGRPGAGWCAAGCRAGLEAARTGAPHWRALPGDPRPGCCVALRRGHDRAARAGVARHRDRTPSRRPINSTTRHARRHR